MDAHNSSSAQSQQQEQQQQSTPSTDQPALFPTIDRLLAARKCVSMYEQMEDMLSRANGARAWMIDEYFKGVAFSPDGSCLLSCMEKGGSSENVNGTRVTKAANTKRRVIQSRSPTKRSVRPRIDTQPASNTSSSSSSEDSSSSSSESESEDGEEEMRDRVTRCMTDRRGLALYELPQLEWHQHPSSIEHPGIIPSPSYSYNTNAAAAAATSNTAAADATAQAAPLSSPSHSFPLPILCSNPGDSIYDFIWNPCMRSSDPTSCFFLSTARSNPIHMWDAYTGKLRATYAAYNDMDELTSAISLAMPYSDSPAVDDDSGGNAGLTGNRIYAGFNRCIRVFDVERPGRDCVRITAAGGSLLPRASKRSGRFASVDAPLTQNGIISCIEINPLHPSLLVAGSYNGEIGMYNLLTAGEGRHNGLEHKQFIDSHGIAQVKFSADGLYLFVNVRHDDEIRVFDMRNASINLARIRRSCRTNQRLSFDLDAAGGYSRFLVTGDADGHLLMFDLTVAPDSETMRIPCTMKTKVAADAVNGVSMHPQFSSTVPIIATCSGERRFFVSSSTDSDSGDDAVEQAGVASTSTSTSPSPLPFNSLALWNIDHTAVMQPIQTSHAYPAAAAKANDHPDAMDQAQPASMAASQPQPSL